MAKQRQNEQAASQWMLKKRERMLYGDGAESSDLIGLENPRSDQDPTNEVTLPDQSDLEMRSASPIKPDSSTSTPIPDSNSLPSRNGNGSSSSISDPHLHPHGSPCGIKRPASTAPITSASEIRATSLQKIEDDMDFNSSEGSNALGLKSLDNNLGDGSVEKEIADAMNEESFKKNGDSMDWSANNSPKNLKTVLNENGSAPTSSNSTPQPVPAPSPTTVQTLSTGKGFLPSSLSSSVHFLSVLQAKAKIQYMRELQEKEETAVKEDVARKEREKGLENEREAERERERRREKDEKERIEKEKETATDNGNGTATADQQNQPASGTASASATNQTQAQASAIKTSDTHPINISTIVPMELIPLISSRIYDSQSGVLPKKVLSELEEADKEGRSRQEKRRSLTNGTNSQPSDGAPNVNGSGSKPEEMEEIGVQPSIPVPSFDSSNLHSQRQVSGERLIRVGNTIDLAFYSAHNSLADGDGAQKPNGSSSNPSTSTIQSIKKVGNLFLSSCPGKKVRLTGPVRGRGAICRDLGIDLSRIHLLGVGAVVCCLDDEELALLGAPWSEYEREADSLGLHVVRLPMAEGYAPSDVATIDAMVTAVAQDYSLRGRNVLIHCRGGVGRAGLVACAWLMKMGLVRQVQLQQGSNGKDQKMLDGGGDIDEEPASDEIIKTVENLIETIRRRRSPKAIETAEQVKFVVDVSTLVSLFS